jgi:hypothetical protein
MADRVVGKRQPKSLAHYAAALERQAGSLAADAKNHPELFEPGEEARYRRQATDFRRKAFTLRVKSRGSRAALRAVPRQRRSRERRPSASRRVSRTAGARGDPHPGDDDPEPLSKPWRGLIAASARLHVHLQRRTAKAAA